MLKFCICIQFFLLIQVSSAFSEEKINKPHFRISYGGGADRAPFVQLIQTIYEELGFNVSIISIPARRGMILLNDGLVDGDVIRLKRTVVKYNNVVVVEPALGKGNLVLLCHKGIPCDLYPYHLKMPDSAGV